MSGKPGSRLGWVRAGGSGWKKDEKKTMCRNIPKSTWVGGEKTRSTLLIESERALESQTLSGRAEHNLHDALLRAYAAAALKAVCEGDADFLSSAIKLTNQQSFTDVAVAMLMARHGRLGRNSPARKVPAFLVRYILIFAFAPFDLLNDVFRALPVKGGVIYKWCGITWIRSRRAHVVDAATEKKRWEKSPRETRKYLWIPNASEDEDCRRYSQNSMLGSLMQAYAPDYGSRSGSQNSIENFVHHLYQPDNPSAPDSWKLCKDVDGCSILQIAVKRSLVPLVVDGDQILHIADRIAKRKQSTKSMKVVEILRRHLPRLQRNSRGEIPFEAEIEGVKVNVGCLPEKFPRTGKYGVCLDMLQVTMPIEIHFVNIRLGAPFLGSHLELWCCEEVDGYISMKKKVDIYDINPSPPFRETQGRFGKYRISDVQTVKLSAPLKICSGYVAIFHPTKGALNFTCALGDTLRRRWRSEELSSRANLLYEKLDAKPQTSASVGWSVSGVRIMTL